MITEREKWVRGMLSDTIDRLKKRLNHRCFLLYLFSGFESPDQAKIDAIRAEIDTTVAELAEAKAALAVFDLEHKE